MSILICGITTADRCGNNHRLKVRVDDDGSMSYHFKSLLGSTSFSLSNLALKEPLPEMRSDTLNGTIEEVLRVLRTGSEIPVSTDRYAQVATAAFVCPHCGGDL